MNEIATREDIKEDVELEKDEISQIIDQLPLRSNITFTGGEVFLKKGFNEILKKATDRHIVTLASNGVLLEKYSELVIDSGVQAIGVSLDGPPEVHDHVRNRQGVFENLQKGLRSVIQAKLKKGSHLPIININSVILKENYSTLPEVVKLVKKLGANSCTFQIFDPSLSRSGLSLIDTMNHNENSLIRVEMIDPISLKRILLKVLDEGEKNGVAIRFLPALSVDEIVLFYQRKFNLSKWQCYFPWNTIRISPYGDVYPCLNYYIGNVRENKLGELWNNDKYVQFRRLLKQNVIFRACIGCCKMLPKEIV
jgi:MoaA/NifB/PqqE/SkfB family radical SAM enzyme